LPYEVVVTLFSLFLGIFFLVFILVIAIFLIDKTQKVFGPETAEISEEVFQEVATQEATTKAPTPDKQVADKPSSTLMITKLDSRTGKALEGATFEVSKRYILPEPKWLALIVAIFASFIIIKAVRKEKIAAQEKRSERLQTSSAETSDQLNICRNCINDVGARGTCEDCEYDAKPVNAANDTNLSRQNATQLIYDNSNSNMPNNNQLVYTGEISASNNLQDEYSRIDSVFGKEINYSNENED
jgi:hypothetical protein